MRAVKKHGGARPGSGPKPGPPTKAVRLPVPIAEFARKLATEYKPGDVAAILGVEGGPDTRSVDFRPNFRTYYEQSVRLTVAF